MFPNGINLSIFWLKWLNFQRLYFDLSVIFTLTHQYNTRTNKGNFQDALASIEQNTNNSINSIKSDISSVKTDEINNLKDVIIKRLQDVNATFRERCSKLEQRLVVFESSTSNLEQYGIWNNIVISCVPDSVDINHLEVLVTSNDIKACHRIGKKNNRINRTKTIIWFVNRRYAKKALFNKKKLSQNHKNYSFNTNNNPLFIGENLTRINESLAYQGRKLKRNNLVNVCYTRHDIVTIKINDRSKAINVYHMNDLLDLFPDFDFDDDESFYDASPNVSAHSMYWDVFGCC